MNDRIRHEHITGSQEHQLVMQVAKKGTYAGKMRVGES